MIKAEVETPIMESQTLKYLCERYGDLLHIKVDDKIVYSQHRFPDYFSDENFNSLIQEIGDEEFTIYWREITKFNFKLRGKKHGEK